MPVNKLPIISFSNQNIVVFGKLLNQNPLKLILIILLLVGSFFLVFPIRADELEQIENQIKELEERKKQSEDATKPLEGEVESLEKQISFTLYSIAKAEDNLVLLSKNITAREKDFAYQSQLLETRVEQFYKFLRSPTQIFYFFASSNSSKAIKQISYQKSVAQKDKEIILKISRDLSNLEADKLRLEQNQITLKSLKERLASQQAFFETEIAKAREYQKALGSQIQELSAKQQAIIAARSGTFTTSAGNVPIGSDFEGSIAGFQQKAPAGSFAVFSFGAYTHRKGMSQYGAKARAENGQDFKQILSAYYGKEPVSKDTGGDISVDGHGNLNFEDRYLYGIAEMPSSWHPEALKAQAVAARTYAYRFKAEGRSICTTEACQVYSPSKADNPPEAWKKAVDETKGQVLEDVVTFYSSTSGGYLTTSGWDTTDKSGAGDWTSRAYESLANSPWFYKAWYRNGYRNDSANCGRYPWLSQEEMADIINAWLLRQSPGSADISRILPITIASCPIGGQSGDPYSMAELRSFLSSPVTSINSVTVSNNDQAQTTQVIFQTNRGSITISGSEFKEIFNTRAPGYISIPQSGFAFFNIEKK